MLEFILQGLLFLIIAFMFLMVISLVQIAWGIVREWNENR